MSFSTINIAWLVPAQVGAHQVVLSERIAALLTAQVATLQDVHMCQPSVPNQPYRGCSAVLLCRCLVQEKRQLRPQEGSWVCEQPGLLFLPLRSQEDCWPGKGYLQWECEGEHWRRIVRGFGLCRACFHTEACCTTGCKTLKGTVRPWQVDATLKDSTHYASSMTVSFCYARLGVWCRWCCWEAGVEAPA